MTNFNFLKYKNFFLIFSTFLVLASFILMFTKGLDFGVDFKGGTTIEIRLEKKIEIEKIRNSLSKLKINNYSVKEFGAANDFLISTDNSVSPIDIKKFIEKDLNEKITIRKVETVGPKVGSELIKSAIYSVLLCFVAMFFYLWFRFEWQFSFGGIVALFHDTIITVGVFSLLGLQFDLTIVAALLTIIGYSINDTVIIYDRIRENLKKDSSSELSILVNESLNNTLSRTLKTSGTTLFSIIALFIFGGVVFRGFFNLYSFTDSDVF